MTCWLVAWYNPCFFSDPVMTEHHGLAWPRLGKRSRKHLIPPLPFCNQCLDCFCNDFDDGIISFVSRCSHPRWGGEFSQRRVCRLDNCVQNSKSRLPRCKSDVLIFWEQCWHRCYHGQKWLLGQLRWLGHCVVRNSTTRSPGSSDVSHHGRVSIISWSWSFISLWALSWSSSSSSLSSTLSPISHLPSPSSSPKFFSSPPCPDPTPPQHRHRHIIIVISSSTTSSPFNPPFICPCDLFRQCHGETIIKPLS